MRKQRGVSLIEAVIFVVVLGIVSAGLLMSFSVSIERFVDVKYSAQALQLAQGRMDIILGQKDVLGFDGLTDICAGGSPPAVCDLGGFANDFTVTSAISTEGSWSENGNVKMITVNIGGLGYASLNTLVARS